MAATKGTSRTPAAASSLPFPVSLLWTARYEYSHRHPLARHRHADAQLFFIVQGRGVFHLGDRSVPFSRFDCLVTLPDEAHGLTADRMQRVLTLEAKFRIHPRLRKSLAELPRLFRGDARMQGLLSELRVEGERKAPFHRARCDALLSEFLILRLRRGKSAVPELESGAIESVPDDDACRTALAFIDSHYATPLSMDRLATETRLSYRQLSRRLREQTGLTPVEHLRRRRVLAAQEQLRSTDLSCEAVAGRTGFETASHFNRVFRRLVGLGPAAWRRREREGIRKDIVLEEGFTHVHHHLSDKDNSAS